MYISLVLFKENIGIFNLGHDVFHQHCKSYKKDIHDVFQHYFADGLAALYSSVDLSSVYLYFSGVHGVQQDCGQEPQTGVL